jgi:hypothetical protein
MNVKTKNMMAVLCVSALAIPAGVAAKGPSGDHGKSGDPHGQNQKPKHVNKRCGNQPKVGFSLHGTLNSGSNVDSIIVDVKSANKHSKPFLTPAPSGSNLLGTWTVPSGSNVVYQGANPFGPSGGNLSDYKVGVKGKVVKLKKGCTPNSSPDPTIKRVKITAPSAGEQKESGSNVEPSGSNQG